MYIPSVKLFKEFTLPLKRIETAVENHCTVIPRYNIICSYNVITRYNIIPGHSGEVLPKRYTKYPVLTR